MIFKTFEKGDKPLKVRYFYRNRACVDYELLYNLRLNIKNIKAMHFAISDKRKHIFFHEEGFFLYWSQEKKFMLMTFCIGHWEI